jgi:hypothetical protein
MSDASRINLNMNEKGPSIWNTIHSFATQVNTDKMLQIYLVFLVSVSKLLPCEECRIHFTNMINDALNMKSNIYIYNYIDKKHGIFYWSWQIHNLVNERLSKPYYPYKEAYENYYKKKNGICDKSCSITQHNNTNYY